MIKTPRINTKTGRTKTALFEAASFLFAQGGTPSLAEIAGRAGVGRATLHRHFSTREQFLNDMAMWALQVLNKAGSTASLKAKTFEDALWLIIEALIPHGDKYNFLVRESQTLNQLKIEKALLKSNAKLKNLITDLQKTGVLDPEFTVDWITSVIDGLIYMAWEQTQKGDLAPNAAGALVKRTLLGGFGSNHNTIKNKR